MDHNQVDAFVEWAKARLDEMAAGAKALELKIATLDAELQTKAKEALKQVQQWIEEGQQDIEKVKREGETAITDARAQMKANWDKFEVEAEKWVEQAKNEQATFEARAKAQVETWQNMVETYAKQAAAAQAEHRAGVEVELGKLKQEAEKAQSDINAKVAEFNKAGETSWAAMSAALQDSRKVFVEAIETTSEKFSKAMKA
jgi:hypothetical protein